MKRCLKCANCRVYLQQRAAYQAAISEARDSKQEVDNLQATWNAEQREYPCTDPEKD